MFNTWDSATSTSLKWANLGGDCLSGGNTTTTIPGGNGKVRVTISISTSTINNWLLGNTSNFGLLIKSSSYIAYARPS